MPNLSTHPKGTPTESGLEQKEWMHIVCALTNPAFQVSIKRFKNPL